VQECGSEEERQKQNKKRRGPLRSPGKIKQQRTRRKCFQPEVRTRIEPARVPATIERKLECGPMPKVMAALSNTGGACV